MDWDIHVQENSEEPAALQQEPGKIGEVDAQLKQAETDAMEMLPVRPLTPVSLLHLTCLAMLLILCGHVKSF